jgi:hypothetical protein
MEKAEQGNVKDLDALNPNFKGFMANNIQANWTQCESCMVWDLSVSMVNRERTCYFY